ncbi:MAG TPA: dihydropyrimidinase [Spirochaetia bacterium]
MKTLVIKGGVVVTPLGVYSADVLVNNGVIAAIGSDLDGDETYNARGRYVLPGGIDVHTHMAMPFGGTVSCDDFSDGTRAGAFGGITSIVDFAIQGKGQSLADTIAAKRRDADGKVYTDYGLHVALTDVTASILEEMPSTIAGGVPTFKCFMTYPGLAVDDYTLFTALKTASGNGGRVSVHAENLSLITRGVEALLAERKTDPWYHAVSRPDFVEAEAVSRAIMWAEQSAAELYIVHLSTAKGLALVQAAQRRGVRVIAETCPQYLVLSEDCYREPGFNGAKYVMSPPLRAPTDQEALWDGLADGSVATVASDHCPFTMEQKRLGLGDFSKIPNGAPGTETILPLLHSEGVCRGRLSLERMCALTSANPARIFGMSTKGAVEPGKDADLVIFAPREEWTLDADNLHSNADYSLYEGRRVTGRVVSTLVRGRFVVQDGRLTGSPGWGRFLARSRL